MDASFAKVMSKTAGARLCSPNRQRDAVYWSAAGGPDRLFSRGLLVSGLIGAVALTLILSLFGG
jgi:hypothetical protein